MLQPQPQLPADQLGGTHHPPGRSGTGRSGTGEVAFERRATRAGHGGGSVRGNGNPAPRTSSPCTCASLALGPPRPHTRSRATRAPAARSGQSAAGAARAASGGCSAASGSSAGRAAPFSSILRPGDLRDEAVRHSPRCRGQLLRRLGSLLDSLSSHSSSPHTSRTHPPTHPWPHLPPRQACCHRHLIHPRPRTHRLA